MEIYRFALGTIKKETKQERKDRLRKEQIRKYKDAQRQKRRLQTVPNYPALFKKPRWRILPDHACNALGGWIDFLPSKTYLGKIMDVQRSLDKLKEPVDCPFVFPVSKIDHKKDYIEKAGKVLGLLQQNQDMRWTFKKLLLFARIRHMKKANDTDPITMEAFKQPIRLYSYSLRMIYTFEAEAFAKHFHKNLLHNDAQIPLPQFPKNPFTNEALTLHQLIGLYHQCKQGGHTFWTMEGLKTCGFSLSSFSTVHSKPLRLHALHTTVSNVTDWDAKDMLLDFMKTQHRVHKIPWQNTYYKWLLNKNPNHDHVNKWRTLCKKWYEIDILIDDADSREDAMIKIEDQAKVLCEIPEDLQRTIPGWEWNQ